MREGQRERESLSIKANKVISPNRLAGPPHYNVQNMYHLLSYTWNLGSEREREREMEREIEIDR